MLACRADRSCTGRFVRAEWTLCEEELLIVSESRDEDALNNTDISSEKSETKALRSVNLLDVNNNVCDGVVSEACTFLMSPVILFPTSERSKHRPDGLNQTVSAAPHGHVNPSSICWAYFQLNHLPSAIYGNKNCSFCRSETFWGQL